jgi:hypothetical protein
MSTWKAMTESEFEALFLEQYGELDAHAREIFERFRVPTWRAIIRRSEMAGDETVFVVAQSGDGVLYFDDVEFGFNTSTVDGAGRIISPRGNQLTLAEAVDAWFPKR